jgi:hypothetical protein
MARSSCDGVKSRWRLVAPLAIVMLTAGCAVAVGGTAQPASSLTPRPLTGQSIERALLGGRTLSRILKRPFNIDPRFPPRFGGPEALRDNGSASPVECLGVAEMLQQKVYRSSKVTDVAVETWRHAARSADVTSVKEGVVSLPTAADAGALFANFSQRWQKCDRSTTPLPGSLVRLTAKITHVQVATSVLAATVSIGWTLPAPDSASIPAGRAIAVRGNCLVEVEVDFFGPSNLSYQGSGDFNTTAIDIARAMTDRVAH